MREVPWNDAEIVLVDMEILLEAQSLIVSCEHCTDSADMTFDYLLDAITGFNSGRTEYLLPYMARCPHCFRQVNEKTLVVS
jgi:hypothetical protein